MFSLIAILSLQQAAEQMLPANMLDFLPLIERAWREGLWMTLSSAALVLCVGIVRKFGPAIAGWHRWLKWIEWFRTHRGGQATVFLGAFGAALLTSALAAEPTTWGAAARAVYQAMMIGLSAIGLHQIAKKEKSA